MDKIKYRYKTIGGIEATVVRHKGILVVGLYDKVLPIEFNSFNEMEDFLFSKGYKRYL
jgi:hypothetical protein